VSPRAAALEVDVEGRSLRLSNLDKPIYPAAGFTKGAVIDYYTRIAPVLIPHLRGRPLTLKRYPDGVDGKFFYEKNCPAHRPEWVRTTDHWSGHSGRTIEYCLADDLATIVWLANLAALELHPSLSRGAAMEAPTMVVFDLDPGAPAAVLECAQVAIELRDLLARLRLETWAKTSGSKGLQVYAPLNTPTTYRATKPFAHAIARLLERDHPELVVSRMTKSLRGGKVLVDWSQNDQAKTTISIYSLRARDRPTVSTPLAWDEVEDAVARQDADALRFEAPDVLARVERDGDLLAPLIDREQELPAVG
jgi:bifunctional non-homologous end joining protein LigD